MRLCSSKYGRSCLAVMPCLLIFETAHAGLLQFSSGISASFLLRWYDCAEMVPGAYAGGAAARASAVRSRVRSAGARQRKGASGYGESSSSAVPQQLHHNDEV